MVDRVARIGAPLAVLAVGFALLLGERMGIEHELLLVAPSEIAPGGTLPARALLFDRLDAPGGPRRVPAEVQLELVDGEGDVRAHAVLEPSPAGAEGMLAIPATLEGTFTLRAVAHLDGEPVASARTAVEVTARPAPAPRLGRMASALQHFELGAVRGSAPPAPFEVRVASGACVPEAPCALLVHVGEPAASVRVQASPSVTPSGTSDETSGIVRLPVVVHGPEAHAEIVAMRGGVEVGRRALQLPVALATPALAPGPCVFDVGEVELEARVLGERPALVADLYRDGAWVRTSSLVPGEPSSLGTLAPGLWRVQVHADPFSSERAAVRTFVVRERGARAVAHALDALGPAPAGPAELRLAWAAAPIEDEMYALPAPVSGRAADVARLEARRGILRIAALSALALGLAVAGVLFFRRGIEAAREAARVMDATGDPALSNPARRRRGLLSALLLVATLLLALLAAAALIIVRARLYE